MAVDSRQIQRLIDALTTALPAGADRSAGFARTSLLTILGALQMVDDGTNIVPVRVPSIFQEVVSSAIVSGTPNTLYTPNSGKKIRLLGFALGVSVTGLIIFKYGAAGTEFFRTPVIAANGSFVVLPPGLGRGIQPAGMAANDVLKLDANTNLTTNGFLLLGED